MDQVIATMKDDIRALGDELQGVVDKLVLMEGELKQKAQGKEVVKLTDLTSQHDREFQQVNEELAKKAAEFKAKFRASPVTTAEV